MRSEETTVLLEYSVYFSKFTSEILILVRKAASKQVEAIIKAFANTNQRRKAKAHRDDRRLSMVELGSLP